MLLRKFTDKAQTNLGKIFFSKKSLTNGQKILLGLCTINGIVFYFNWGTSLKNKNTLEKGSFIIDTNNLHTLDKFIITLPTNTISWIVGCLSRIYVPLGLRTMIFGKLVNQLGIDITEAIEEKLENYSTFESIFCRKIKPELRPVDERAKIVSPCDGIITEIHSVPIDGDYYEVLKNASIDNIKGVNVSLYDLMCMNTDEYESKLLTNFLMEQDRAKTSSYLNYFWSYKDSNSSKRTLYYAVIYLAPYNYHWFHAPINWRILSRHHIPGSLFPVRESFIKVIPTTYLANERVIINGSSDHLFDSTPIQNLTMIAIGALAVGSINLVFDATLKTNDESSCDSLKFKNYKNHIQIKKGEEVGNFSMGSTIVLAFTGPPDLQWNVLNGQKVKLGQSILI